MDLLCSSFDQSSRPISPWFCFVPTPLVSDFVVVGVVDDVGGGGGVAAPLCEHHDAVNFRVSVSVFLS